MVKVYVLFKFNPGMEHRIWSEDDKRRSKEFIERRLKVRRIFRSLKSFVSGRLLTTDSSRELNDFIIPTLSEDGNPARANTKQALDALVLRMASAAAKPCQGDSLKFY
ncbi:hypothetical protein Tco_0496390 [Tanacetum coccineum]